jgi:soluble lytic murein transglycosylase-like protein
MKIAISCLVLVCPAFCYGPFVFPSSGFALPGLGFYVPASTLPASSALPEPRFVKPVDAHALIRGAAAKHRVPAAFVKSIVAAESNFNCDAISAKGAIGLMQLMPETAKEYGADPSIPEQNIDAGTHYLRVLMDKYHRYGNSLPRVIAAYNAGPGMVDRYHGVPPFRETRRYVVRVLRFLRFFQRETDEGGPLPTERVSREMLTLRRPERVNY